MIDPVVRIVLLVVGGASMALAIGWAAKDWKVTRFSGRALAALYTGAVLALIGLQPLRTFRMVYSEPYVLPPVTEARERLLDELHRERWIIGVARPDRLVDRNHPLQPEVAARFERYAVTYPRLLEPEAPSFIFVGRKAEGWSRNPDTTTATFLLLGVVLVLSGFRQVLRRA